jgi:hypothetical protein
MSCSPPTAPKRPEFALHCMEQVAHFLHSRNEQYLRQYEAVSKQFNTWDESTNEQLHFIRTGCAGIVYATPFAVINIKSVANHLIANLPCDPICRCAMCALCVAFNVESPLEADILTKLFG